MKRAHWREAFAAAALAAALGTAAAQTGEPPPSGPLAPVWEERAPHAAAVAVAPDGSWVAVMDRQGVIRCFDAAGRLGWTASAPGADRLALAAGSPGRHPIAAAYALRRPLASAIALFGPGGRPLPSLTVDGPVTALALAADGTQLVAANEARVHWFRWKRGVVHEGRFEAPAPVRQLHFAPGNTLYLVSEGPEGFSRVRADGSLVWQMREAGARERLTATALGGQLMACASAFPAPEESIRLQVRAAGGTLRWETRLPGRMPRPRLVANGTALLLAYEQPLLHRNRARYERRLAYFDLASPGTTGTGAMGNTTAGADSPSPLPAPPAPNAAWTTGGAYTGASLFVAAAADGGHVVSLEIDRRAGTTDLRLLNRAGRKLAVYAPGAPLSLAAASEDGSRIAACCLDDTLRVLAVAPH